MEEKIAMEGEIRKRKLEKSESIPTDDIIHGVDEKDSPLKEDGEITCY